MKSNASPESYRCSQFRRSPQVPFKMQYSSSHGVHVPSYSANANSSPSAYRSVVTLKTPFTSVSSISKPFSMGQCVQSPRGQPTSLARQPGWNGRKAATSSGMPHV